MTIRTFQIEYGGYGFSESVTFENDALLFSSWDLHTFPDRKVRVVPTEAAWKSFVTSVRPVVRDWRRKYDLLVCDGITWSVFIETDQLKVRSRGTHLFPENFSDFLVHVRRLLQTEDFASGFSPENYMSCHLVPHPANRRIRRMMRARKVTIREMAVRLALHPKELTDLLNSPETFQIEYLLAMAAILKIPCLEFLYECFAKSDDPKTTSDIIRPEYLLPGLRPSSTKDLLKGMNDN